MTSNKIQKNTEYGFTLVETLVAISVLLISLAGPMSIAAQGLFTARVAEDQLAASYLAQEAVEFIRNTRDNNVLSGAGWLSGITGECGGSGCTVDVHDSGNEINSCSADCDVLRYNEATGFYGYDPGVGWEDSIFTRTVMVDEIVSGREAEIEVTVSWPAGGRTRTFTVRENIFDWQ